MALVRTKSQPLRTKPEGKHEGHTLSMFARKFWVSLALTIPILLYSPLPEMFLGWAAPQFPLSEFIPVVLGSIVFFYGGWVFLAGAWRELRGKAPGMMTLIALAIVTAYVYSVVQVLLGGDETLFWELTTLITIMLLGHWMEMRAVQGAQGALRELSKLLPDVAERVTSPPAPLLRKERGDFAQGEVGEVGAMETVPLSALRVGDVVLVRPGGKVPADGEVVEGTSDVNESLATGESKPVAKKVGSAVIAGTINGDGALKVRVTKIGEATFLAGVMRLVREAQASKSKLQLLSDRAAFYLTIIAVVGALTTLGVWLALAEPSFAFTRMVAVLVIACPHALGLAIPLVASISTTMAARNGFLVKQRLALEAARDVDVVLFDKTGTLTKGEYGVTDVWATTAGEEKEVLRLAVVVDAKSEHPIARAIVKRAQEKGVEFSPAENFERLPGKGTRGKVQGKVVSVGGKALLADSELQLPEAIRQAVEEKNAAGATIIYVLREETPSASPLSGGELVGVIALGDIIRDESREAVKSLTSQGVEVAMITGDARPVADWVAKELGIATVFAQVLPEHKASKVKELQRQGKKVVMVGDGINDAPALTQADVGIAIGAGTNVAIESAGIILVRNDPRDIPKIIRLSRLTYTKMLQNLFWATGYNVVALPLAAGVAAAWGVVLNPALSAVFMSLSTVIVAVNAVLLRHQEKQLG